MVDYQSFKFKCYEIKTELYYLCRVYKLIVEIICYFTDLLSHYQLILIT